MTRFTRIVLLLTGLVVAIALTAPRVADAAGTYFHQTTIVTAQGRAVCPQGWHVTGGGAKVADQTAGVDYLPMFGITASYPDTTHSWEAQGWAENQDFNGNLSLASWPPDVWAVCER